MIKNNILEKLSDTQKTGESIKKLREANLRIPQNSIHEFTYILYDLRTLLGNDKKTFLEIGSYMGSSASLMLQHNFKTNVICIDPCELCLGHFEALKKNLENNNIHNYGVEILKNYSNDTNLINKLKANNTKVDILFIDGDHTRQAVINDWNNFKDFVNPGGFICFDDYYDDIYASQVRPAVDYIVQNLDTDKYEAIGSIENIHKLQPVVQYNHPDWINEFIIYKKQ